MEVINATLREDGRTVVTTLGTAMEVDQFQERRILAVRCGGQRWQVFSFSKLEAEMPMLAIEVGGPSQLTKGMILRREDEPLTYDEVASYLGQLRTLFRLIQGTDAVKLYELLSRENHKNISAEKPDAKLQFLMKICACAAITQKEINFEPNAAGYFSDSFLDIAKRIHA